MTAHRTEESLGPFAVIGEDPLRRSLFAIVLALVIGCTEASRLTSPVPETEVSASVASSSLGYVAIDLGTVLDISIAFGINDAGVIVGASRTASLGSSVALRWVDGVIHELPGLDAWSAAADVDDQGLAVGVTRDPSGIDQPAVWDVGGDLSILGVLEDGASVTGTNAPGSVRVGSGLRVGNPSVFTALRWANGVPETLSLPPGAIGSRAFDVNLSGVVVGSSSDGVETRPTLWTSGGAVELPILGLAEAVNTEGVVVGSEIAFDPGFTLRAFSWRQGAITYLPDLGGQSAARAVNDEGVIGGVAEDDQGVGRPVLWISGVPHELPTLGGLEGVVRDVNGHGHAVGASEDLTGVLRATLWRPLTPVEAIEEPIAQIEDLVASGDLNRGEGTSLINKLNIATAMLNDGKTTPAINQLEAFIKQVEAMIPDQIDPVEGQTLIEAVQAVIDAL